MNSCTDFSGCELLVKHSLSNFFFKQLPLRRQLVKLLLEQLKQQLQKYN